MCFQMKELSNYCTSSSSRRILDLVRTGRLIITGFDEDLRFEDAPESSSRERARLFCQVPSDK